jgi:hypothetical protein
VLWLELAPPSAVVEWTTIDAVATESACKTVLVSLMKRAGKEPDTKVLGDNMYSWNLGPGRARIYRYVCLPDTVDPRGPKER